MSQYLLDFKHFSIPDHHAKHPCGSNEIYDDNINSYSCRCQADFTGEKCETKIDDCNQDPCKNYGTCTDGVNSYSCDCQEGFTGDNCEIYNK